MRAIGSRFVTMPSITGDFLLKLPQITVFFSGTDGRRGGCPDCTLPSSESVFVRRGINGKKEWAKRMSRRDKVLSLSQIKISKMLSVYASLVQKLARDTNIWTNIPRLKRSGGKLYGKGRKLLAEEESDILSDETATLGAIEYLRAKTLSEMGMHAGELYEIIIKPIATAMGKQVPEILFALIKFPLSVLLRDITTSGLEGPVTTPVLNQLDPSSMFGAGNEETPTQSTAGHGTGRVSAGISDDISLEVTDNVLNSLTKALWHKFEITLPAKISGQASRQVSRSLLLVLTHTLTQSISRGLVEVLSTSLTKRLVRGLNSALIPTLTHTLVPTITHSLMHHPKTDYFCYFCDKEKVYCDYCIQGREHDFQQEYYIGYYSGYYSAYYTGSYSSLGDIAADNQFYGA